MADLYVEIKKDVNFLNVIIDMEKVITKVANFLRLDLSNIAEYPALTVTGEFSSTSLGISVDDVDLLIQKNLIPNTHNEYIIGNSDNKWKEVHCMSLFVNGVEAGPNPTPNGIPMALSTSKLDTSWLNANTVPAISTIPVSDINAKILTSWLYASNTPTPNYLVQYDSESKIANSSIRFSTNSVNAGVGLSGGGPIVDNITISLLPPASCSPLTTNIATSSNHTHQIIGVLSSDTDITVSNGLYKSGALFDGTITLDLPLSDVTATPPVGGGPVGATYGNSICTPDTISIAYTAGGHTHKITGFALTAHTHSAVDITAGILSGLRGILAGASDTSFVRYTGTTKTGGAFYGGSTAPIDVTNRLNYAGYFYANRVYNAVYNDYAECFSCKVGNGILTTNKKIMEINDSNEVVVASNESTRVIGIVSNTYGFLLNGTDEEIENGYKVPIAMSGTVYVMTKDLSACIENIGKFIVSAGEGYCKTIEFDEVNNHIGEIVGKVIGIKDNNTYKVLVCIK